MGTLRVTGYVRGGSGLSADSLVHIPGLGDMQLDRITDAADGHVLHAATAARPSLQSENDVDPFGGGGSPFRLVYSGAAREFVVTELSPACRYRFRLRRRCRPLRQWRQTWRWPQSRPHPSRRCRH